MSVYEMYVELAGAIEVLLSPCGSLWEDHPNKINKQTKSNRYPSLWRVIRAYIYQSIYTQ